MIALLLALLPGDGIRRDSVELAEFNVVATASSVSIAQIILWDGVEYSGGFAYRCRDWRSFRLAELLTVSCPWRGPASSPGALAASCDGLIRGTPAGVR